MRFVTAWCVVSLSPLILVCFVFSLLKRLPSHPTLKFNHFYIYGSERTKIQSGHWRVLRVLLDTVPDCPDRNGTDWYLGEYPRVPSGGWLGNNALNLFNSGRNSGGHNFSDSEIHIPTVITSQSVNAVTSQMTSPVNGRMDYDCISRLVEIDAILEEDRDESMDANYRIANIGGSHEDVDLNLLVTLKNPTISKQKQIQIGLETLTGMAFDVTSSDLTRGQWPQNDLEWN